MPRPERVALDGRYARLEPLDPARHGADLLASARQPSGDDRFRYLFEEPPADMAAFRPWFAMTDGDWPRLKAGFEAWLRPENFDAGGQQRGRLAF